MPQRQHDTAELIDHLHPKLTRHTLQGETAEGLDIRQQSHVARCLQLAISDSTSKTDQISVQGLIQHWHEGADIQAGSVCSCLDSCIELGAERLSNSTLISFLAPLDACFVTADNLDIRWVEYEVLACIQHHGSLPTSGHYTVVLSHQGVQWHYDDEKVPLPLTASGLNHLSTNVYVIFAKCSQAV